MTTTVTAAKVPSGSSRAFGPEPLDHRFLCIIAIVSAVTIIAAFSSTYVPKVVAGAPTLPSGPRAATGTS